MVKSRIKFVGDLDYATPEEFTNLDYGQEVIDQYSKGQKIPILVLEIEDLSASSCIVLAG